MITLASVLNGTFRFIRHNPGAIAIWATVNLLLGIGGRMAMRPMIQAQALAAARGLPPAPHFGPLLVTFPVLLLLLVVLYAAVFRGVIAPGERRAAYLRLGMDELRLLATSLILTIGFYIAFFVLMILLVLAVVAIMATGSGRVGAIGAGALLTLPIMALILFFGVRLSPAGVLTMLRGKVVIGEAWRLTRGHFWVLFGSYAIVGLLMMAGYLAIMTITMAPFMGAMTHAGDPAAIQAQVSAWQMQQMSVSLTAAGVLTLVAGAAIGAVMLALQGGCVAVATVQLVDDRAHVFG